MQLLGPKVCIMSVSVDIVAHGHLSVPLTPSSTAADVLVLLQERLPDRAWHGNQGLSCGARQLQHHEVVEARHGPLVLANYSEISNMETWLVRYQFFVG